MDFGCKICDGVMGRAAKKCRIPLQLQTLKFCSSAKTRLQHAPFICVCKCVVLCPPFSVCTRHNPQRSDPAFASFPPNAGVRQPHRSTALQRGTAAHPLRALLLTETKNSSTRTEHRGRPLPPHPKCPPAPSNPSSASSWSAEVRVPMRVVGWTDRRSAGVLLLVHPNTRHDPFSSRTR